MSRRTHQEVRRSAKEVRRDAISEYLAALEEIYPQAKGIARVQKRQDNRVIVSVPLPARARERMRLFDHMAEVGTKLLLETNEYIILSSQ
ncbi:MAG: hypothetical protein HY231_15240 [Acidobacteria bacterium]|nr:hypothetical protein [Acidobacteriota bacterium]